MNFLGGVLRVGSSLSGPAVGTQVNQNPLFSGTLTATAASASGTLSAASVIVAGPLSVGAGTLAGNLSVGQTLSGTVLSVAGDLGVTGALSVAGRLIPAGNKVLTTVAAGAPFAFAANASILTGTVTAVTTAFGGGFSTTTGDYTAPVRGVYVATANVRATNGGTLEFGFLWRLNGTNTQSFWVPAVDSVGRRNQFDMYVTPMNAGDTLNVFGTATAFSGSAGGGANYVVSFMLLGAH